MHKPGLAISRTDLSNDDANHAIKKAGSMDYFFRIYYTDNNDSLASETF